MIALCKRVLAGKVALLAVAVAFLVASVSGVEARPTYFETLKARYSIADESNLDACGVCHLKWEGTGARNLYGGSVQQHLYLGKSIEQSLEDVEAIDSDGDGFSNLDELLTWETLPGYSCADYFTALDAPSGYDQWITPMVATCLEPLDIRLSPFSISMSAQVGEASSAVLTVYNNGSSQALTVSDFGFAPGGPTDLIVSGPGLPFDIQVGESVDLQLDFIPLSDVFQFVDLEVSSNDPDEPVVSIQVLVLATVRTLAPLDQRVSCQARTARSFFHYSKHSIKEWSECYTDEVDGLACDSGARDLAIARADLRLDKRIGGSDDRNCAGKGLTPYSMNWQAECPAPCEDIELVTMSDSADCQRCRQEVFTGDFLSGVIGDRPPDLPAALAGTDSASRCQQLLARKVARAVTRIAKLLSRCEVKALAAGLETDCLADTAQSTDKLRAKVNAEPARCDDQSGLGYCLVADPLDTDCLGDTAWEIAIDLNDSAFGRD